VSTGRSFSSAPSFFMLLKQRFSEQWESLHTLPSMYLAYYTIKQSLITKRLLTCMKDARILKALP